MPRGGGKGGGRGWTLAKLLLLNGLPLAGFGGLFGTLDPLGCVYAVLLSCVALVFEFLLCGRAKPPQFLCFLSVLYLAQYTVLSRTSALRLHASGGAELHESVHGASNGLRASLAASRLVQTARAASKAAAKAAAKADLHPPPQAPPAAQSAPPAQSAAAGPRDAPDIQPQPGASPGASSAALEGPGYFPPTPESPPSEIKTVSVVLPCAEERELALKTAAKFCERTPEHALQEVVVVDDGSSPPLKELFQKSFAEYYSKDCNIVHQRHSETLGLMIAKQTGGKAAKGDVVAFFDCHVSPKPKWSDEIFKLVRENPKRMVVPMITDLDLDTFEERKDSAAHTKCYLTWDADFKWFDDQSDYIPAISGGLVAMTRWWFKATGGFDEVMRGWGGENLDQSLRSWLCGGEIMRAKSSRIAHMWRTGDRRTSPHYHGSRGRGRVDNRARVVAAWYDVFSQKYPGRKVPDSEVRNYDEVKKSLGCKPFAYFLYRFRHVYIDGGVIAEKIFHFRDKGTGLCLSFSFGKLTAEDCSLASRGQKVQLANQDPDERDGKCCSGIRLFGSNNCLDYVKGGIPMPYSCDITGNNRNQQYRWRANGKVEKAMDSTCFGRTKTKGKAVKLGSCEMPDVGFYELWGPQEPLERNLYQQEIQRLGYDKLTDLPGN